MRSQCQKPWSVSLSQGNHTGGWMELWWCHARGRRGWLLKLLQKVIFNNLLIFNVFRGNFSCCMVFSKYRMRCNQVEIKVPICNCQVDPERTLLTYQMSQLSQYIGQGVTIWWHLHSEGTKKHGWKNQLFTVTSGKQSWPFWCLSIQC